MLLRSCIEGKVKSKRKMKEKKTKPFNLEKIFRSMTGYFVQKIQIQKDYIKIKSRCYEKI